MTHILIIVAIIAFLLVIAEHTRLASRVSAAETALKAIDTKIAGAMKADATAVVADVKKVEQAL